MEDNVGRKKVAYLVKAKFELGLVAATAGVEETLSPSDVVLALARHAAGDWGELDRHDWRANDEALKTGGRLVSAYRSEHARERFYVITEADRSVTTLLLPSEY